MNDAAIRNHAEAAASPWQGKARTLLRIASRLKYSRVPESFCISYGEWCQSRRVVLETVLEKFGAAMLAIRSSARDEDHDTSNAGHYRTLLNIAGNAPASIAAAIDAVFHSYGAVIVADEALVQAMVTEITHSFVASTHAIDDHAPYYTLSYVESTDCDAVTRGNHEATTIYIARDAVAALSDGPSALVLAALRELELLFPNASLEAEMIVTPSGVALLQVRPLVGPTGISATMADEIVVARRRATESLIAQLDDSALAGSRRLFGQMPDWNPAELLGSHPRPLALSLFRRLISECTWREARAELGYRRVERGDLLCEFAGRPYVDVRLSFNSFLPPDIGRDLANGVVDAWMDRLRTNPHLHDKVEFDVAVTCLDFDWLARWRQRYDGFSAEDLRRFGDALVEPTRQCLDRTRLDAALAAIRQLHAAPIDAVTVTTAQRAAHAFALIARQAFSAESMMRSAVRCGVFHPDRLIEMRSLAQSSQYGSDDSDAGRLRPGTFEISVPSYSERGDALARTHRREHRVFNATASENRALARLCDGTSLPIDAALLIELHSASIHAREYAKFVLSLLISQVLDRLRIDGATRELDRETLAWLDLDTFCNGQHSETSLRDIASRAKHRHAIEHLLRLPTLFDEQENFEIIRCPPGQPNYQGSGIVEARIVRIDAHTRASELPRQCIVAVENADPGYDWIFSRAPLALVTAYGGPNSHMAIRCAESGCGAVLGYGPEAFRSFARAIRATIDFDVQTIEIAR